MSRQIRQLIDARAASADGKRRCSLPFALHRINMPARATFACLLVLVRRACVRAEHFIDLHRLLANCIPSWTCGGDGTLRVKC